MILSCQATNNTDVVQIDPQPDINSTVSKADFNEPLNTEGRWNERLKVSLPKEFLDTGNKDSYAWVFHINGVELQKNNDD